MSNETVPGSTVTTRNIGDSIRFQVMPWVWPAGSIHEGVITKVVDSEGDTYYHVDATINGEQVSCGVVFEREVVEEQGAET